MSNPVTNAFFFGRALAEVLSEKIEESFTNAMSELGKFDAEQREHLREFIEEVQLRAERVAANPDNNPSVSNNHYPAANTSFSTNSGDLQAMLDQLRAEIASLRAELQKYRN
jgi:methyl-accepting chemotaxis protein